MYLAQYPRLPFCGLIYLQLIRLCVGQIHGKAISGSMEDWQAVEHICSDKYGMYMANKDKRCKVVDGFRPKKIELCL